MISLKKSLLVLPFEVKQREYLAKLYLAILAAKEGYQVALGSHDEKVFSSLSNGIYLYKDHSNVSDNRLKKFKEKGHKVFALDEEGLIYLSEEVYLNNRVSKKWVEEVDAIFCWGNEQEKLIKENFPLANCISVGNPRFDLLHYIREKRKQVGEKRKLNVLFNTRFTSINAYGGKESFISRLEMLGVISNDSDRLYFEAHQKDDNIIFEEFEKAIKIMSEDKDVNIVVRPHPAEDNKIYEQIFKNNNVIIDNGEELVHQLERADVIVHDGCTTAIEGALSGALIIGLRPNAVVYTYGELANEFSHICFDDYLKLHSFIKNIQYVEPGDIEKKTIKNINFLGVKTDVKEIIECWEAPSATLKILEMLSNTDSKPQKLIVKKTLFLDELKWFLYKNLKSIKYLKTGKFNSRKIKNFLQDKEVSLSKCQFITLSQVECDVNYLCKLVGVSSSDICVEKLSKRSFLIYSE